MQLKIYKPGQGYYTRLYSALVLFAMAAIGCFRLYQELQGSDIWVRALVPSGICVLSGLVAYFLVNIPKVADFMINAEGEVKKVSWSSRKQIAVSTFIVIIVVATMAILLLLADFGFQSLFRGLKIY